MSELINLFNFNGAEKQRLIDHVCKTSYAYFFSKKDAELESVIEEMVYWESKHHKKSRHWDKVKDKYLQGLRTDQEAVIRETVDHYVRSIVGNFNPKVYYVASKLIPPFLNFLINAVSFQRLLGLSQSVINENMVMSGNLDWIRYLMNERRGTLLFVPTHMSNVDSIIMGTAFYEAGLPPMMYGAGINLFKNRMLGFFMNNLGAYKVDRLRRHGLYKQVLKEFATGSLEFGYHNLFFPGGTRSRSGAVEKKLKLGLLGTALEAYIRNLKSKKPNPDVYVIPVNLNSHLTLEAETLVDDFLEETGQARFIIENDEFARPKRLLDYLISAIHLNSKIFVHFGDPLDVFGNRVDEAGHSVDRHGRQIDIRQYVMNDQEVSHDQDRDRNYTVELSKVLIDVFHRNNRVLSTNLVAFTLYEMIAQQFPDFDIYRLLRTRAYGEGIKLSELYEKLDMILEFLKQLNDQKKIILGDYIRNIDAQDIVNDALKIFGSYHTRRTVYRKGDEVFIGDLLLLFYYHNRLVGYNLEDMMRGNV